MSEDAHEASPESDAVFLGWQQTGSGDRFALYVVTAANHPAFGSTVSRRGLYKLGLQVPETPLRYGITFGRRQRSGSGGSSNET
jgi:hypothetical protein